jgi:hypothetical protein
VVPTVSGFHWAAPRAGPRLPRPGGGCYCHATEAPNHIGEHIAVLRFLAHACSRRRPLRLARANPAQPLSPPVTVAICPGFRRRTERPLRLRVPAQSGSKSSFQSAQQRAQFAFRSPIRSSRTSGPCPLPRSVGRAALVCSGCILPNEAKVIKSTASNNVTVNGGHMLAQTWAPQGHAQSTSRDGCGTRPHGLWLCLMHDSANATTLPGQRRAAIAQSSRIVSARST